MDYANMKKLFYQGKFRELYNSLGRDERSNDAEWFFLKGVSAMNLGMYEEGADYIKRAHFIDPSNPEYKKAFDQYINYRDDYYGRADYYNRRRRYSNPGCCCCCGNDCCDTCCTLWCADSCCECFGGDLISCC